MPIKFTESKLSGLWIIEPPAFRDSRGYFLELYHASKYEPACAGAQFVQDNYSHSLKGTLRGLHYQLKNPQAKLVTAISGEIFDVVVDIRKGSPMFGEWYGTTLSSKNRKQLYIPEGFAHGFCVLSESADVLYKCTDFYVPEDDHGILWSDTELNIQWPISDPTLSEKDQSLPSLTESQQRGLLPKL